MESKRERARPISPPAAAASMAATLAVLGDDNLLGEILIRLAFPTNLVRAAAVCRRWCRVASDPAFLRRFRDLHHPPRLLGFYLSLFTPGWRIEFVPVLPQPPELAAVVRRARFGLDNYDSPSTRIMNCRNGAVVVSLVRDGFSVQGVHSPLHPGRAMVAFPPPPRVPREDDEISIFCEIVSEEDGDGRLSFFWFSLGYSNKEDKAIANVHMLQDGAWVMRASATTQVPSLQVSKLKTLSFFLSDDKIYMSIFMHNILVLDLRSSTFSTINFPVHIAFDGEMVVSGANGSGVYLVHVDELKLHISLHREGNGSIGDWSVVNTISLQEMCANLRMSNGMSEDGDAPDVYIHEVGHNAEFVFLEIYGCVIYLDVRSRAMQKVYTVAEKGARVCWIHPFKMIWPPTFPALQD
ncbi:hypothetical protein ACP70R_029271 [Stipagrostis hirtigluma subsp. patula]